MPSALVVSILGAFQASVSVLITLSYGFIAARLGMVHEITARDISSLCRNLFLPALLITDIGSQLDVHNVPDYAAIFVWAITYAVASILMGKMAVRLFGFPSWTVPAVAFNNTTSLPLLLTRGLLETGILAGIAGGHVEEAVARARSYFLINSLVSKVLTFAISPGLLDSEDCHHQGARGMDGGERRGDYPGEHTSLLPKPILAHIESIRDAATSTFHDMPKPIQKPLVRVGAFLNPTTWGGIIAAIIGLIPGLHRAAFAQSDQGGFLNAWIMSSLRNIGSLFSAMEMFVVGSKLSDSFDVPSHAPSPQPPKGAVIAIIFIRFVIWGAISIPVIYFLAARTRLLGDDPVLWWSMMLMPISPPGMILSILLEVAGAERRAKMMVARMLAYTYMVMPVVALVVVGALRATEAAQRSRWD
ncbi:hypothetical protein P691DRAFT_803198 [Macrolepiota fuliginosa MF-IS2]|uniref:Auxin efflux carrier n=1 Tax=Macrolepiota fuliginosa MF-IS2 TaxID=1400762 RepID=A0A9P5XCV7_9AGAR|nr:hypothetical protein P691DRAFT_803198 [Macrolepiota fuliginosa MF-IS2]